LEGRPVTLPDVGGFGSDAHRALIEHVVAHYRDDGRVRAVAVFGSVSTGTWHELSDVDLDIVIGDGVAMAPAAEVAALFGTDAAIVLSRADSADVVLDSLAEVSIRWHPLATTSPNIAPSAFVAGGRLSVAEIIDAAEANQAPPDEQRLLDALVRDAVGAWKTHQRGQRWNAVAAVERMRRSLASLRGRRDNMALDPEDPAGALGMVIAEAVASFDFGSRRIRVLEQIGLAMTRTDSGGNSRLGYEPQRSRQFGR
jgi:predicted nucleotidyltransferase